MESSFVAAVLRAGSGTEGLVGYFVENDVDRRTVDISRTGSGRATADSGSDCGDLVAGEGRLDEELVEGELGVYGSSAL